METENLSAYIQRTRLYINVKQTHWGTPNLTSPQHSESHSHMAVATQHDRNSLAGHLRRHLTSLPLRKSSILVVSFVRDREESP